MDKDALIQSLLATFALIVTFTDDDLIVDICENAIAKAEAEVVPSNA